MATIQTSYIGPSQTSLTYKKPGQTDVNAIKITDVVEFSSARETALKSYRSFGSPGKSDVPKGIPNLGIKALTVLGAGAAVAVASTFGGLAGLAAVAAGVAGVIGGLNHKQGQLNQLKAENEELRIKATTDALTKLLNRGAILEGLDQAVKQSQASGQPLGVVMADVDHFKKVNDTYGHPAGDAVLREVARRLGQTIRPGDLVGRYGGEEIVLVLPNCKPPELLEVCERLRKSLEISPIHSATADIPVTASFGATCLTGGSEDGPEQLLDRADAALYKAKESGRNRVELV